MRFTSTFIPILLSAPTVLAHFLYPYAGLRQQVVAPGRKFVSASAVVNVPQIYCKTGETAFVAAMIGDPFNCGGNIEAGVALTCPGSKRNIYAYWQLYPGDVQPVEKFPVNEGDVIHMQVEMDGINFSVSFQNVRAGGNTGHIPGGSIAPIEHCLTTASWGLRADLTIKDGQVELWPIPSFDAISLDKVHASDSHRFDYGTERADRLAMLNYDGELWVNVSILGPNSMKLSA